MLNLKRLGLLALAVAAAACSDSSGGKRLTQTPDANCGPFGCEEADMGDMGPVGGATPMVECTEDSACAANEYCARADENDLTGTCTRGCRDAASCPEGQLCDPTSRQCGGCSADVACPDGQYCDTAAKACTDGCRSESDSCGAGQVCDPATRACVAAVVCCSGADLSACGVVQDAATCADGVVIDALSSCDPNPCGARCASSASTSGEAPSARASRSITREPMASMFAPSCSTPPRQREARFSSPRHAMARKPCRTSSEAAQRTRPAPLPSLPSRKTSPRYASRQRLPRSPQPRQIRGRASRCQSASTSTH